MSKYQVLDIDFNPEDSRWMEEATLNCPKGSGMT